MCSVACDRSVRDRNRICPTMNCMCEYMYSTNEQNRMENLFSGCSARRRTQFSLSLRMSIVFCDSKKLSFAWLFFVIGQISKPESRPLQLCVLYFSLYFNSLFGVFPPFYVFFFCLFQFATHSYCLVGDYAAENRKTNPNFAGMFARIAWSWATHVSWHKYGKTLNSKKSISRYFDH